MRETLDPADKERLRTAVRLLKGTVADLTANGTIRLHEDPSKHTLGVSVSVADWSVETKIAIAFGILIKADPTHYAQVNSGKRLRPALLALLRNRMGEEMVWEGVPASLDMPNQVYWRFPDRCTWTASAMAGRIEAFLRAMLTILPVTSRPATTT